MNGMADDVELGAYSFSFSGNSTDFLFLLMTPCCRLYEINQLPVSNTFLRVAIGL
jgi:hypothetical protein